MDYPTTRKEAQQKGVAHYFTGEPCKHGHVALRKTKGACVECLKVEWKVSAIKRMGYFIDYNRQEIVKESKHDWYCANREQVIEAARLRPSSDKKVYQTNWKAKNVVWVRADTKARRRKHRQATPPWLTRKQKSEIRHLYQIAITMSRTTGEQYVVDHIVPLRGDSVSGLHVPWNLRVVTRTENLAKSNKHVDSV